LALRCNQLGQLFGVDGAQSFLLGLRLDALAFNFAAQRGRGLPIWPRRSYSSTRRRRIDPSRR
jgi:hypothetical protein